MSRNSSVMQMFPGIGVAPNKPVQAMSGHRHCLLVCARYLDAPLTNNPNLCSGRAIDKNHPHICVLPAHTVPNLPYATVPF